MLLLNCGIISSNYLTETWIKFSIILHRVIYDGILVYMIQSKWIFTGESQWPSTKRTKDLLRLNRDQLRWVVGLLTGHCHLKWHLFKLGLTADPICERCLEDDESSIHIICDFEAVAYTRFRHLGQYFMEPSDYYDAPIDKVLHFIRNVGLIKV
jgi:hypothetical protein